MAKKPKARGKRDPFWRLRRIFGERRVESARRYRRQASREAERTARATPERADES